MGILIRSKSVVRIPTAISPAKLCVVFVAHHKIADSQAVFPNLPEASDQLRSFDAAGGSQFNVAGQLPRVSIAERTLDFHDPFQHADSLALSDSLLENTAV